MVNVLDAFQAGRCVIEVIEFLPPTNVYRVGYVKNGKFLQHDIIPDDDMQSEAMLYLLRNGVEPNGWEDGYGGNVTL